MSAATEATTHAPTPSEYIAHHLGQLTSRPQESMIDFSVINIDTVFWSILMGVIGSWMMWRAARYATSGVPGRFQSFVEMLVEMVEDQSKAIIHGNRSFIAPLALTLFVWVTLMNALDFLPVDLVGMLALVFYYNIKIKGLGGWVHETLAAPFGIWLAPFNVLLNLIEYIARTVSLGMRLWGNMYAGELLFLLIALLGSTATVFGLVGHVIAGTMWSIFHILIVILQAFIFMMLTLVYIGQAHEGH